jgi:hypothetical protein
MEFGLEERRILWLGECKKEWMKFCLNSIVVKRAKLRLQPDILCPLYNDFRAEVAFQSILRTQQAVESTLQSRRRVETLRRVFRLSSEDRQRTGSSQIRCYFWGKKNSKRVTRWPNSQAMGTFDISTS